jgi:hypothetical protein
VPLKLKEAVTFPKDSSQREIFLVFTVVSGVRSLEGSGTF